MKNMYQILSVGFIAVALTACGTSATQTSATTSGGNSQGNGNGTVTTGTGNWQGLPPAWEQQVVLSGNLGPYPTASFTVHSGTSAMLKVKIEPANAPNMIIDGYEAYNFPYGALQFDVTVNGAPYGTTPPIQVPGANSGGAPDTNGSSTGTFWVHDFSQVAALGGGQATITLSHAFYDNCRYGYTMEYGTFYGCMMQQVFQYHMVAAKVFVQTDGTWMDLNNWE